MTSLENKLRTSLPDGGISTELQVMTGARKLIKVLGLVSAHSLPNVLEWAKQKLFDQGMESGFNRWQLLCVFDGNRSFSNFSSIKEAFRDWRIEARIPFKSKKGKEYSLVWFGQSFSFGGTELNDNYRSRDYSRGVRMDLQNTLRLFKEDEKNKPQNLKEMLDFVRKKNPDKAIFATRLNLDNLDQYLPGIRMVYGEAFTNYFLDPVELIRKKLNGGDDTSVFYIAFVKDKDENLQVVAITGLTSILVRTNDEEILVSRLGNSAGLADYPGLNSVLKVLTLADASRDFEPDVVYTISSQNAVKANLRVGLEVNYRSIVPFIAVDANRGKWPGVEIVEINGEEYKLVPQTINCADADLIEEIVDRNQNSVNELEITKEDCIRLT